MKVLEIGPGLGVLTEALLKRGAGVTAVEKDRRLAERLHESLGYPAGLDVIEADALKMDMDEMLGRGFDACISNLPYSVGTRILLDVALHLNSPGIITVLVQTEVADRFAADAGTPDRGQSGVWLQLDFNVSVVRRVSAACFWPRPEVSSSIVRLDMCRRSLSDVERKTFFNLTRYAFMHRRKQIGAALRKAGGELECSDEQLAALLHSAGIRIEKRAEQISNEEWKALARLYAGRRRIAD
ncbi:MAG: 16S rRNA (adenine(1518)-N(6)/adenine(1519)-N(6))-dimethyltransferase RsmA [Kiritimatiellia bacterium]